MSVAGGPASGSLDVDGLHSGCRRLKQCFEYGDCIDYFGRPPLVRSCDICVDVSADGTSCMGCDMYFCARCTRGGACIGRDCMCCADWEETDGHSSASSASVEQDAPSSASAEKLARFRSLVIARLCQRGMAVLFGRTQ